MGEKSNNERAVFLSDSPLASVQDDLLGWGKLADNIVKTIRSNMNERGFAISLKGKWGSGKSSLLNFVCEKIANEADLRVLRYNPWLYPEENHVENFFTELVKLLRFRVGGWGALRIAAKLRHYATASHAFKELAVAVFALIVVAGVPLGADTLATNQLQISVPWYITALFLIILVFTFKGRVILSLATLIEATVGFRKQTLHALKIDISKRLAKLGKHIVVAIDDLDRLPPAAICQMFQVVKNNADIENITYLLAFDDDVVKEILAKEYSDQYRFFTEKIIQIDFTLPNPEKAIIGEYFQKQVVQVLKTLPKSFEENWQEDRWTNYYYLYFQHFFSNIRDVKRVVNGIHLNIDLIFTDGTIEVNPVDYITIELIRIRFPSVYDFVRNNSEIFAYRFESMKFLGASDDEKESAIQRYNKCLEGVNEEYRSMLDELLKHLFPCLGTLEGSEECVEWITESRICAPTVFERYFIYGNYTGDFSNYEVLRILDNISQTKEVVEMLKEYHFTSQLPLMLELLLIKAKDTLGMRVFPNDLVRFAFEISDYLPKDQGTTGEIPVRFVITNFVEKILEKYDPSQRANILEGALMECEGIFGPLTVFAFLEPKEKERRKEFIEAEKLKLLQRSAWAKGMNWLKQDESLSHLHLDFILLKLIRWDTNKKFHVELRLLTKDDKNFKLFLVHFLIISETRKYGEIAGPVEYKYDFDSLAQLVDVREIYERVNRTSFLGDDSNDIEIAFETFKRDYREWSEKQDRGQP